MADQDSFDLQLRLMCGSTGRFTDAQLERGWRAYGGELTASLLDHPKPGLRPWGFWRFEANRPELHEHENWAEGVGVLAEMGELTEAELTELAEDAVRAREFLANPPFYHGADKSARQSVEAQEAVERALGVTAALEAKNGDQS